MELEAVTGKGLWGHKGPGSRLACSLYLRCWIEQLSACQLADRLMRTLSHSTQWWKGPYCLTSLIVEPAHISEPACRDWAAFFPSFLFFPLSLLELFSSLFYISSFIPHAVSPLKRTLLCTIFLFFPFSPSFVASLSPPLSLIFSKWWVLAYDRLSQVCFNYRKGDGDSTGEEEGETFVHTLYLRSWG